jgi:hypothetical protein
LTRAITILLKSCKSFILIVTRKESDSDTLDSMEIYFEVDQLDTDGKVVGTTQLCKNGRDKKVDIGNRDDYLKKVLAYKNKYKHLAYMVDGFEEIVSLNHLKIFNVCLAFNLIHRQKRSQ